MKPRKYKQAIFIVYLLSTVLLSTQSSYAAPVHAYFADEHNTTPTTPTGNRIIEIDVENMEVVNTLNVPGILGHHADNGFNSKIYGVPKGSGYVNVIELRKDVNGTATTMENAGKIDLIHKPRSGDAYNQKFNVILMAAANRPMGSFINVDTDEVIGTIGEDVDCTLTDGTRLLSKADANTVAGATKYHCAHDDHGGDQISGHPYWLTPDYAAIVDRANRQISTYFVWRDGTQLRSRLVNHLPTRTSIHQIVPRDRTLLPASQQADFYAIEEGKHADPTDYTGGIAHALIKLKLTTSGLVLDRRMNLQRTGYLAKAKADRILNSCISIYRDTFNQALTGPSNSRESRYNDLFNREGITRSPDQDRFNDFPVDCFYPGIPGGHNADFAPNNKHLYIGMAGGAMSVVDVNRWKIANNIDIGIQTGPGHTCFSVENNVALTSNHGFSPIFGNASMSRSIRYINSERPIGYYWIRLPFSRENIINTAQSHTCYVDENGDNYYNFFTDGGVFYKIDLTGVFNNPTNGSSALVVDSLYTGGIPIQGSFIDLDDIRTDTPQVVLNGNNDTATSDGSLVSIDVLANDEGTGLTITSLDNPNNGTATIVNGKVDYTPNSGYSGIDGFWYQITDSRGWYTWGFVEITVTSTQPPVTLTAFGDNASTGGTQITLDVLANDVGIGLTLTEVEAGRLGTSGISNNQITYTPRSGETGVDEFWYKTTDSRGWYTWGQILVTLTLNPTPTLSGVNDAITISSGSSTTIDVLNNDIGTGLVITEVEAAPSGTSSISGSTISYTPNPGFTGVDEFWYKITDSRGWYTWAQILVTVN